MIKNLIMNRGEIGAELYVQQESGEYQYGSCLLYADKDSLFVKQADESYYIEALSQLSLI